MDGVGRVAIRSSAKSYPVGRFGLVWFGLVWFGWFGLVGLVWFGWFGWFGWLVGFDPPIASSCNVSPTSNLSENILILFKWKSSNRIILHLGLGSIFE